MQDLKKRQVNIINKEDVLSSKLRVVLKLVLAIVLIVVGLCQFSVFLGICCLIMVCWSQRLDFSFLPRQGQFVDKTMTKSVPYTCLTRYLNIS